MASTRDGSRIHYRTCHLCEAICGIEVHLRGDEIVSIRGDDADPFSRGHICPKAVAIKDVHEDPERLRQPVRRSASGWQAVSWEQAYAEAAERLVAVQKAHGNDALAVYFGNPNVHSYSALLGTASFAYALRTRNRYSATSVDQLPHHFVAWQMYGHQLLIPIADIDRTAFLLVLGANPVVSNGSLMTAPGIARRLKDLRARGGRLVVIDPRRTETAEIADEHVFIRPGTDALLLLALLHVVCGEGLARPGRLESHATGWDTVRQLVAAWPPERVSEATGIDPERIRGLARAFAAAPSAACYGRMGASTQAFGGLTQWLVQLLNFATGNLDRPGGAMFTQPAFDLVAAGTSLGQTGHYARRRTRVRGLPEFSGEFPVAALAEEILTPGEGQTRALVTVAGNPVLSTPDGTQLDRALASLDYMVSVDFYINETTRHAHLILPPTFALERDHYDVAFHALAIRNTSRYSAPLFPPPRNARHDWQIFRELGAALERVDPKRRPRLAQRTVRDWLTPRRMLALGIRLGPRGARWNPLSRGLTLGRVASATHGLDLGPLEPALPGRLRTGDHRIALAPELLCSDVARLERRFATGDQPVRADASLLLIGRRDPRTNNSWMHNSHRLVKGKTRCTVLVNPADAAARGLAEGALARVSSRVGRIELPVEVTADVMPGVVSIPHGWGHSRPGVEMTTAREHAGASINDLTDASLLDELCGTSALSGVPVWIEAMPVPGK